MTNLFRNILRYNPSRARLEQFVARAAKAAPAGSRVLDAGAGEGYYRPLFDHAIYHGTDLCKVEKAYGRIHYISDLSRLPAASHSYDVVICTQVFEHLAEPGRVLGELYRVLKPGGQLWFSAPFFFPEHEIPYDFYRYTRYGLRHLLEAQGFDVVEMGWLEGYFGSLGFECRQAARNLPLSANAYGLPGAWGVVFLPVVFLLKCLFFALSLLFYFLEPRMAYQSPVFGKNLCGTARKPEMGAVSGVRGPQAGGATSGHARTPEPNSPA